MAKGICSRHSVFVDMFLAVKEPIKDVGTQAGHLGASLLLSMIFGLKLYVNHLKLLSFDSGVNHKKVFGFKPSLIDKIVINIHYMHPSPNGRGLS